MYSRNSLAHVPVIMAGTMNVHENKNISVLEYAGYCKHSK